MRQAMFLLLWLLVAVSFKTSDVMAEEEEEKEEEEGDETIEQIEEEEGEEEEEEEEILEEEIQPDNHFTQMVGCPDNLLDHEDDRVTSTSVMDCARKCAKVAKCLSFNYLASLQGSPNCGLVPSRASSCTDLQFFQGAKHYYRPAPAYSSPWKLALLLEMGLIQSGSVAYLIQMVQLGAKVRILINREITPQESRSTLYDVDAVWVVNDSVTAQIYTFHWIMNLDFGRPQPQWTRVEATTDGSVVEIIHSDDTQRYLADMHWFVRDTTSESNGTTSVALEISQEGEVLRGSANNLISATRNGFPVQMQMHDENMLLSFPVTSVVFNNGNFSLSGTWMDGLSKAYPLDRFTSELVHFQNHPMFSVVVSSNFDLLDVDIIPLNFQNNTRVTLTVDPCWEKVYINDKNGGAKFGSFSDLMVRADLGFDIRVIYQCSDSLFTKAVTVDYLLEYEGIITAFSATPGHSTVQGGVFNWMTWEIGTNGTVRETVIGRNDGTTSRVSCQARVSWFADKVQREMVWSFNELDQPNPQHDVDLLQEQVNKGLMPRVVFFRDDKNFAYSLQKLVRITNPDESTIEAFNYRSFAGTHLAFNSFDSISAHKQIKIKVDRDPGPLLGMPTAYMLFSLEGEYVCSVFPTTSASDVRFHIFVDVEVAAITVFLERREKMRIRLPDMLIQHSTPHGAQH